MSEPVLHHFEKHTAFITLNRPEKRNALNQALLAALYDVVEACDRNPDIRVIVITGRDPAFLRRPRSARGCPGKPAGPAGGWTGPAAHIRSVPQADNRRRQRGGHHRWF